MMINFNTDLGDAWEHAAEGFLSTRVLGYGTQNGYQCSRLCPDSLMWGFQFL